MILQSHAEFRFAGRSVPGASRLRIGMVMLVSIVALLTLLNLLAGRA